MYTCTEFYSEVQRKHFATFVVMSSLVAMQTYTSGKLNEGFCHMPVSGLEDCLNILEPKYQKVYDFLLCFPRQIQLPFTHIVNTHFLQTPYHLQMGLAINTCSSCGKDSINGLRISSIRYSSTSLDLIKVTSCINLKADLCQGSILPKTQYNDPSLYFLTFEP
jgi:hypothetical protein